MLTIPLLEVGQDVVLKEFLHLSFTKDSLHVPEELESLLIWYFIWYFRERIIRVISFKNRVNTSVSTVQTEIVHCSP